jgi:frataxin-like iron-binding protein CyaY
MFYATQKEQNRYARELWQAALAGGRVNYHQLFPHPTWVSGRALMPLLEGELMRGQCRVRLLNFISATPLDCPVAVVFGHAFATNWAGPKFLDSGVGLAENYWKAGYPADLIPSSEIGGKALRVGDDGFVHFGPQRYAAAVLWQPDLGKPPTAEFWRSAAAGGKTALYRFGDWTTDFDGKPFSGNATLPPGMEAPADITRKVPADLRQRGVAGQECFMRMAGRCRLIDGTEVVVAGDEKEPAGLPIKTTLTVGSHKVTFDAIGIAAVRLSPTGQLEALAAGGLKSFRGGGANLDLPDRADLALWRDGQGVWQGVLQGVDGPVPAALLTKCPNWLRLACPVPYRPEPAPGDARHAAEAK